MRSLILAFVFISFSTAFASSVFSDGLYHLEGPMRGHRFTTSGQLGTDKTCFVGHPKSAQQQLWKHTSDDIEKASPFVRYDSKKDQIVFGYTDTKCTDEGEPASKCRASHVVARCPKSMAPTGILTCVLKDPKSGKSIRAAIVDSDPEAVAYTKDEIGEISFNLDSPSCDKRGKCTANVTFSSSRIQDEVGSMTIEFSNKKTNLDLLVEPIHSEDLTYEFTCAYLATGR